MPNKPRPENRHRMVRVEDKLWAAAKVEAAKQDITVSEVMREALRQLVAGATARRRPRRTSALAQVLADERCGRVHSGSRFTCSDCRKWAWQEIRTIYDAFPSDDTLATAWDEGYHAWAVEVTDNPYRAGDTPTADVSDT